MARDFITEDVEYLRRGDRPLLARLYRPKGPGPRPGLIEVHGGAWTTNDRLANTVIHEALARAGVFVMAVDFRMPPEAPYPASLCDINYATRWLKLRAKEFGLNPGRIGGLGSSSGAHQLMLSALRPRDATYSATRLPGGELLMESALCRALLADHRSAGALSHGDEQRQHAARRRASRLLAG